MISLLQGVKVRSLLVYSLHGHYGPKLRITFGNCLKNKHFSIYSMWSLYSSNMLGPFKKIRFMYHSLKLQGIANAYVNNKY